MACRLVAATAALLLAASCSCGRPVCGPGTKQKGDACVASDDVDGEGEGDGDTVCGPGTVLAADGATCAPQCAAPRAYDDAADACVCPPGALPDGPDGCRADPALCGAGTVFDEDAGDGGACVVIPPAPNADDDVTGAPVDVALPGIDDPIVVVGGVLDLPTGGAADIDTFRIVAAAGARVHVSVVSFGAPGASFAVVGRAGGERSNIESYLRFGLPSGDRTAFRALVLPVAGTYDIVVSGVTTFTGGVPLGGDDFTYDLVLDVVAPVPPVATLGDGDVHTGDVTAGEEILAGTATIPVGAFVDVRLAENDEAVAQLLWTVTPDGGYLEVGPGFPGGPVTMLVPQIGGGARVHADFSFVTDAGASTSYRLAVEGRAVAGTPQPNAGLQDLDTFGEPLSFFALDVDASSVYRIRAQFPETTTVGPNLFVVDAALAALTSCAGAEFDDENAGPEVECRLFGGAAAGPAYVVILDAVDEGIAAANNHVRLSVDAAALAASVGVGVGDPPATRSAPVPDVDPDAWSGPWFLVDAPAIEELRLTTDNGVAMNLYATPSFALDVPGVDDVTKIGVPAAPILVQAIGGPGGAGDFTFTTSAAAPPFPVEQEPNGAAGSADAPPHLDTLVGATAPGDTDYHALVVDEPGLIQVIVDVPPDPLVGGDVTLELLDVDGATVLRGPIALTPSAFFGAATASVRAYVAPGTYYARVSFLPIFDDVFGPTPGNAGQYSFLWLLDPSVVPPGSCADPAPAEIGSNVADTNAGTADFAPLDAACFGAPPSSYTAGAEAVFAVTIPPGMTLVARAQPSEPAFDPALALVANCASACLAGSDVRGADAIEYTNDGGAPLDALLVVDGFEGTAGGFDLDVRLFGDACGLSDARCSDDGLALETCNADATGFDVTPCAAGCVFDAFNQRAQCNRICGPGTDGPAAFCAGAATLSSCRPDGTAYDDTSCVDACIGDAASGFCTFGLCAPAELGTSVCVAGDVFGGAGGGGDGVDETFVSSCNANASSTTRSACAVGAACDAGGGSGGPSSCDQAEPRQQICTAGVSSCAAGIGSVCDAAGTRDQRLFCTLGCDAGGFACEPMGESCASHGNVVFPADGETIFVDTDSDLALADDVATTAGLCDFESDGGNDLVTSFVATESTLVTIEKDAFDGVIAFYEGACGLEPPVVCEDDFGFDPTIDSLTAPVVAGRQYFVVVAPFFTAAGGPFTLTITNEVAVP